MVKFEGYELLVSYKNIDKQAKVEVHGRNIPKTQRKCIFCGQKDATFTKVAHAISETVGNKSLISHYECDRCNESFGKMFEDNLGKYMLPYKIITQTFGKSKQLTSKDIPKDDSISYANFRIQVNKNVPVLAGCEVKGLIIEKENTGIIKRHNDGLEISIPRQQYDPPSVYCAFLKMAYSILPLEFYQQYVKGILVLQQLATEKSMFCEEQKREIMEHMPNCGLYCFLPGINPLGGINVMLWKKSVLEEEESYPQMLFTLEMKNFSFTIPVVADDEKEPLKFPEFFCSTNMQYRLLDFTQQEKEFNCELNAIQVEIEKQDYSLFEEQLRNNKLLK